MGRLPLPYHGQIGHKLRTGEIISIQGFMPVEVASFTVNFHIGDDIALHFNARFYQGEVVRNASFYGEWGDEEKEGDFPFHPNQHFDIAFLIKDDKIKASVNGKGFMTFHNRASRDDIDHISINSEGAEVYVNNVQFQLPVEDGVQTKVTVTGNTKLPKKYAKYTSAYQSQSSSSDSD